MAKEIDVYKEWLDISEPARPLNYYQLLKLEMFDDEPANARNSYRRMNAHVRKYAAGEYGPRSQELLNELAKAMLCLTDATRKAEYDVSLGRAEARATKGRTLEEILVGRKIVESAGLEKARRYAKTVGVEIRDALMQQKLAPAEAIMQAYAESVGLPFVDVNEIGIDERLVPQVPAVLARQQSCAPLMIDDGRVLVVSPNQLAPEIEDQLRLRFNLPVRTVLCTPAGIHELIAKHYSRDAAAAELAGGPPKAAKAKPAQNAAAAAEAATTDGAAGVAPVRRGPMTPEERAEFQRQRKMKTLVAFNFGLMGTMFLAWIFHFSFYHFWLSVTAALLIACTAAGVTWNVSAPKRW